MEAGPGGQMLFHEFRAAQGRRECTDLEDRSHCTSSILASNLKRRRLLFARRFGSGALSEPFLRLIFDPVEGFASGLKAGNALGVAILPSGNDSPIPSDLKGPRL